MSQRKVRKKPNSKLFDESLPISRKSYRIHFEIVSFVAFVEPKTTLARTQIKFKTAVFIESVYLIDVLNCDFCIVCLFHIGGNLQLASDEGRVGTIRVGYQFRVSAPFDQLALVNDAYHIGIPNGTESVSHNDDRHLLPAALNHVINGRLDGVFGNGIEG